MSKVFAKTYQFNCFGQSLIEAVHNFNSHNFRFVFTNKQPLSLFKSLHDIDEINSGNGYNSGGIPATLDASYEQEGISKIVFKDVLLKATDGDIGPFRFIVFANNSIASNHLCWFYDLGSEITLLNGNAISLNIRGETLSVSVAAESY